MPRERRAGLVGVLAARVRHPQLRGALAGELAQAAFGLGRGDLREHVGFVDLLDRDSAHADVAVGSSDLDQDGSVVRGQSPDGFGADADVAVAVLGAKEISNPHGRGGESMRKGPRRQAAPSSLGFPAVESASWYQWPMRRLLALAGLVAACSGGKPAPAPVEPVNAPPTTEQVALESLVGSNVVAIMRTRPDLFMPLRYVKQILGDPPVPCWTELEQKLVAAYQLQVPKARRRQHRVLGARG